MHGRLLNTEKIVKLEENYLSNIIKARKDFHFYCSIMAPDFYTEDKEYLIDYCDALQTFIEGDKLLLIVEMPPRHGKTRTLVLFATWLIGNYNETKIITSAYNDTLAMDFSKTARDIITEEKNTEEQITFSDIFNNIDLEEGRRTSHQWALKGKYFTFKSSGIGGTITGKGANLLIIDDPIKSAEEAMNDLYLDKLWSWYTNTWLSRTEHGAKQIIEHTPWSQKDLSARARNGYNRNEIMIFQAKAFDGKKMLCEDILSYNEYKKKETLMDAMIFKANYDLERVNIKGVLYGADWKTYTNVPKESEDCRMFCDTADKGEDYLCAIWGHYYNEFFYVVDVYFTKDTVEKTIPELARLIVHHKTQYAKIEANSGGHAIANHIDRLCESEYTWNGTVFDCFTQTKNKMSRILSNAKAVKDTIVFPVEWAQKWPEFHSAVVTFLREGKNKHDDAPDVLTLIVENKEEAAGGHFFYK